MVHHLLNASMRHALRMELISRNPVSAVTPPSVRKHEAVTPDIAKVRQLLVTAELEDHRLWPAIHLVAFTGMRRGEVLALQWKDVDRKNRRLKVVGSLVITANGLSLEMPKTTSGERVVDLDDRTVAVLRSGTQWIRRGYQKRRTIPTRRKKPISFGRVVTTTTKTNWTNNHVTRQKCYNNFLRIAEPGPMILSAGC